MSGFDSRICVVWGTIEGITSGNVNFLTYGDKNIRTYPPGSVGLRVADTPFVDSVRSFGKHLKQHPNEPCRMPVGLAKQIATVTNDEFCYD